MRAPLTLSVIVLLAAACGREPPATRPGGSGDTVIENVAGYTWADGALRRFDALRFDSAGVVVARYSGDSPREGELRRIDGGGATLLPGLIDAHGHVLGLSLARNRVDLVGTTSLREALQRVADFAAAHPEADWILGRGWNQVLWAEKRFPSAADLDSLDLDRPVWLRRIDGHAAWANALAMERAGIDDSTPDPHGGAIHRDSDGAATGVFVDTAMTLVETVIPEPGTGEKRAALKTAFAELVSLGLTSVHDAGIGPEEAGLYRELAARGEIPLRVYAMLDEATYEDFGPPLLDDGSGFLAIRSIKSYLDGALGSRGAALMADYSDDAGNSGLLFKDTDTFAALAAAASQRGFQVNVHAIGDAANRVALDAFARLDTRRQLRHRIEHAQIVAPGDIARFGELGVIASMQPIHATSDMNMAEDRIGPQRIAGGYAWRKLLDSGARMAGGSDFPVEPANPMFGLYAAVTRRDHGGEPSGGWYADQALSIAEALRLFTLDAAYAAHQESQLGSLQAGKRADFILLDRDIMTMPPDRVYEVEVLETWVDGKRVYRR